jgi:hypothetical protein
VKVRRRFAGRWDPLTLPAGLPHLPPIDRQRGAQATVLVGAEFINYLLERLLRSRMIAKPEESLFSAHGALSSFAARIDLVRSLGLITKGEAQDLHRLRRIRNEFAHSFYQVSFYTPRIKSLVDALHFRVNVHRKRKLAPRQDFIVSVAILGGFLLAKLERHEHPDEPRDMAEDFKRRFQRQACDRKFDSGKTLKTKSKVAVSTGKKQQRLRP